MRSFDDSPSNRVFTLRRDAHSSTVIDPKLGKYWNDPTFCYSRIAHGLSRAAFIISSLTRPRLASGVTIVTSTRSRAPTTKM